MPMPNTDKNSKTCVNGKCQITRWKDSVINLIVRALSASLIMENLTLLSGRQNPS